MTYPSPIGVKASEFIIKCGSNSNTVQLRCECALGAETYRCFNNGASFASSSSNDIEPLSCSPLMKKVGVVCRSIAVGGATCQ